MDDEDVIIKHCAKAPKLEFSSVTIEVSESGDCYQFERSAVHVLINDELVPLNTVIENSKNG